MSGVVRSRVGCLSDLLGRPKIERPIEEFRLPPQVEPSAEDLVIPTGPGAVDEQLLQDVEREAQSIQSLIEAIESTTPPDLELTAKSGRTVTFSRYREAGDDPVGRRTRQDYEDAALDGCGLNSLWPSTALHDLRTIRDELLLAAGSVSREVYSSTAWAATGLQQHIQQILSSSQEYRRNLYGAVGTYRSDVRSGLMRYVVAPYLDQQESLQEGLEKLESLLENIRRLLCNAQMLWVLRFREARSALSSLAVDIMLQHLLGAATQATQQASQAIVTPVMEFLRGDGSRDSPLEILQDDVSQYLGQTLLYSSFAVIARYQYLGAQLLRRHQQQSQARLQKVRALAQHNTIGRHILYIDAALLLIRAARQQSMTTSMVAASLGSLLDGGQPPTSTPLIRQLEGTGHILP